MCQITLRLALTRAALSALLGETHNTDLTALRWQLLSTSTCAQVREKKEQNKSRQRFWEMAGSKMGKITGLFPP